MRIYFFLFLILFYSGCQAYGPHQVADSRYFSQQAEGDFDAGIGSEDKGPGAWLVVTLAIGAAIATSILLPLYLNDQL